MNWFTQQHLSEKTNLCIKQDLVEEWGGCDHVTADPALLAVVSYENDTWGKEGFCYCQACWDAAQTEEDEKEVVCHDCKQTFKAKETRAWKWYDFDPRQGDEPLIVCDTCRTKEKHIQRKKADNADYEREFAPNEADCD